MLSVTEAAVIKKALITSSSCAAPSLQLNHSCAAPSLQLNHFDLLTLGSECRVDGGVKMQPAAYEGGHMELQVCVMLYWGAGLCSLSLQLHIDGSERRHLISRSRR